MKLVAQIKLQPTKQQADLLKKTIEQANATSQAISDIAWQSQVFTQYSLHHLVYRTMKEQSQLAAQVIVRCIAKVAHSYKLDNKKPRTFKPLGSIAFDNRILTYVTEQSFVTIWTIGGRQKINYLCGEHQKKLLESRQGESDLVFYKGNFYLLACCEVAEPTPADITSAIGIDLGIVKIAVDSLGESFNGETVEKVRKRYHKLRRDLQACGSKNAKRHLKKIAQKEARFRKDQNHCIAKKLVKKAEDTKQAIGLEDLKHIRSRTTVRKADRARHSGWAFAQLQAFILYKAMIAGIKVVIVDARNSSRECSECHHIAKANRKSQALFCCVKCKHSENADLNAAKNIAHRASVNKPIAVHAKHSKAHAPGTASSRYTTSVVSGSI